MAGSEATDEMDLCDDSASQQPSCSIYPFQRARPLNPILWNRLPVASTTPSDLSQHETEWSLSSVSAQSSHEHSAPSESQQDDLLSALAAEARQLWESATLTVGSPTRCAQTYHPEAIAPLEASALLMPAFAGMFDSTNGVDVFGQPKPMSTFADPHLGPVEHFGTALQLHRSTSNSAAAAAAVRRRHSINDAIDAAAAAAAASAFCGLRSSSVNLELEEFSLGPGFPRCPP
jgi:hypothetical protein